MRRRPHASAREARWIAAATQLLPQLRAQVPDAVVFTEALGRALVARGRLTDAEIAEAGQAAGLVGGLYWSDVGGQLLVVDLRGLK